jgi:hypothetical protein
VCVYVYVHVYVLMIVKFLKTDSTLHSLYVLYFSQDAVVVSKI